MRFQTTVLAIAASLAVASAQDLSGVPQCAIPCFVSAVPDSGCGITDTKCQCTTGSEKITNSLLECAPQKCDAKDVASLAPAVSKLCAQAGVTLSNIPTAAVSSGSAAATGSASGSAASTTGTRSATGSASGTGAAAPEQTENAAHAKAVGYGVVAMGMAAVFGL